MAYSDAWYTPSHLLSKTVSQSEIRKEYTRLRDIAQKRIKRLAASEFRTTRTFKKYQTGFKTLKEVKSPTELAYEMSKLYRFVQAGYTVSQFKKQRRESLKTLHRHRYDFVNEENYQAFSEFMEDYRDSHIDKKSIGSPDSAELYYQIERLGLDSGIVAKDFNYWFTNLKIIKNMKPSTGKSAGSVSAMKKRINNQIKKNSKRKRR